MAQKTEDIHYSLLSNGLDFILSALEYLSEEHTKRNLKYAVLHLSSGIELILKERLRNEHWSLIFARPENANKNDYESGKFPSVDFEGCLKRLSLICDINIPDDIKGRLTQLRNKRNKLEHFGISDTFEAIVGFTSGALSFMIDFVTKEIRPKDPDDEETMDEIRRNLIYFDDFVVQRIAEINDQLENAYSAVVTCTRCLQDAAIIDIGVTCLFCGHQTPSGEQAADEYVTEIRGLNSYEVVTQGGEWPIYTCPECSDDTLVYEVDRFICFSCGEEWDADGINFCETCGTPYQTSEDEFFMCKSCIEHRMRD